MLPDGFTPKGNKLGTPSGSILFYFGDKVKRFQTVFGKLGIVRYYNKNPIASMDVGWKKQRGRAEGGNIIFSQ